MHRRLVQEEVCEEIFTAGNWDSELNEDGKELKGGQEVSGAVGKVHKDWQKFGALDVALNKDKAGARYEKAIRDVLV